MRVDTTNKPEIIPTLYFSLFPDAEDFTSVEGRLSTFDKMLRQAVQRLLPAGQCLVQQAQRNFGVSAAVAQKGNLDPIQQLFVDKIREYRTKSVGGKLVDATAETETALKDSLANLERAYGAKGVDMTQFPTLNFTDPELVWPGLTPEQVVKMNEAVDAAEEAEAAQQAAAQEPPKYDPWEGL
ncbi:ATP synthase-coupling factor 6, mitochondrial [Elysia marginata]|uniref:ATP synthase-coupling factor 6, mitochondrial n=1 Tax=Elysia marginata TaxID=1093978 RepID=A0AAV4GWP5_9GAST|nr:ATP synthase-coupling factor 6, mitochondrial [Elysia marginata]